MLLIEGANRLLLRWKRSLETQLVDLGEAPSDDNLRSSLRALGAHRIPHSRGRSLFDHLIGTAEILRRWSAPEVVVQAASFHSVYSTDRFSTVLTEHDQRDQISGVIGTEAERLVYLFGIIDRAEFVELLTRTDLGSVWDRTIQIRNRKNENELLSITRGESIAILMIYAANLIEQSAAPDGAPTQCLAAVCRIATLIATLGGSDLPFFRRTDPVLSGAQEVYLLEAYRSEVCIGCSQPNDASRGVPESWLGELWVWRSFWAYCDGCNEKAREFACTGKQKLLTLGAAWDKRLSLDEWIFVAEAIERQDSALEQAHTYRELISTPVMLYELIHHHIEQPQALRQSLTGYEQSRQVISPSGLSSKGLRVTQYLAEIAAKPTLRTIGSFPGLRRQAVWDPLAFPLVQALESSADLIRAEIAELNEAYFHEEAESIRREGAWDVFMLYERGKKNFDNCARCPVTTKLIERYDTMRTVGGLIYVSKMRAHTHIDSHRGPTNLRLRCHLGLDIPVGDCGIRVGHQKLTWNVGKCIIFDDFFEHEAWNNTDVDRIVLIVDIWHPEIEEDELAIVKGLHRYAYIQAEGLQSYWKANENKVLQRRSEYD